MYAVLCYRDTSSLTGVFSSCPTSLPTAPDLSGSLNASEGEERNT